MMIQRVNPNAKCKYPKSSSENCNHVNNGSTYTVSKFLANKGKKQKSPRLQKSPKNKSLSLKRIYISTLAVIITIFIGGIHIYLYYLNQLSFKNVNSSTPTNIQPSSLKRENDIIISEPLLHPKQNHTISKINTLNKLTLKEARIRNEILHNDELLSIYAKSNDHNIPPPLLTPLTSNYDKEYFTIRINSYRRNEQLLISLNHFSTCDGVAKIQVIWCDTQNQPPDEIKNHLSGKVEIEYHTINTLNERFHVLKPTPTLGILSIDDDVLRPCMALDAGFLKWTLYPHRMVGYDGRIHVVQTRQSDVPGSTPDDTWAYGYLSDAQKNNQYSMSLTRFSFLHVDYLKLYYNNIHSQNPGENTEQSMGILPSLIFDMVTENLNCEDIAMSFFISSLTCGKPPLLAYGWAVDSMVKLHTYSGSISSSANHKKFRDECVNIFADLLQLKPTNTNTQTKNNENSGQAYEGTNPFSCIDTPYLQTSKIKYPKTNFRLGVDPEKWEQDQAKILNKHSFPRKRQFFEEINRWTNANFDQIFKEMIFQTQAEALSHGLIAHTKKWRERWNIEEKDHH